MFGSGGNKNKIAGLNRANAAFEHRLACALQKNKELIDVVHLRADLAVSRNIHEHHLAVLAGDKLCPEKRIIFGEFEYVLMKFVHGTQRLWKIRSKVIVKSWVQL